MILAIVGSRNFNDYDRFVYSVNNFIADCSYQYGSLTHIVSGGATGADRLAERYAIEHGYPMTIYKPDWANLGKAAGPIRNKTIINSADCVLAFWDGISKGTGSSVQLAKSANKMLKIIYT